MTIILCGMPCCGKSHYGKRLAESLAWAFIDLDLLIEERCGLPCRTFMLTQGETAFRRVEKEVIDSLSGISRAVIAPGGGAPLDLMCGKKIYLKTDPEVLYTRLLKKKELPAYLDPKNPHASFQKLLQQRIGLYERYADATIETQGLSEEEILWQAITLVRSFASLHGENLMEKPLALS